MRPEGLAALAAFLTLGVAAARAEAARPDRSEGRTLTGKERLAGKAADEQRVDDCKVPAERRGRSKRPTECGGR